MHESGSIPNALELGTLFDLLQRRSFFFGCELPIASWKLAIVLNYLNFLFVKICDLKFGLSTHQSDVGIGADVGGVGIHVSAADTCS